MITYEYQTLYVTGGLDSLVKQLNVAGATGWECFQIDYRSEGLLGTYIAFLKKVR